MTLIIAKPVFWNTRGYTRPSGVSANTGFPRDYGFGHEEWNNSQRLEFEEDGVSFRAFHTERVGNAPVTNEAGRTVLFMYASHDRVQELVGVAANVTCLVDASTRRKALAKELELVDLGNDAWDLPQVRARFRSKADFNRIWRHDVDWIPNWICPSETFLWLEQPAIIDPYQVRGKSKLLSMFGSHTILDAGEALRMLESVPEKGRSATWHRIRTEIEAPDDRSLRSDLSAVEKISGLRPTTRQQLVDARLGQGRFRRDLEKVWGGACAVSGCRLPEVLRASHILPWTRSNNSERLDKANGLLLTAELDALFDRGLISFADKGDMLVSGRVAVVDRKRFGLPRPLRQALTSAQRSYLAGHRRQWGFEL